MAKKPAIGIRKKGAPPKPISRRKPLKRQPKTALTHKQQMFIERYVLTLNATQAYLESHPGITWGTANTKGSGLLKDIRIGSEIKSRLAPELERYRPDAANVLAEFANLAFSNIRDTVDANGAMIPLHQLPRRVTAALKKVKTKEITATDLESGEEKVIGHVHEIEMVDKVRPLHLLGLQEGMFGEKVEMNLGSGFAEALRELREREARVE